MSLVGDSTYVLHFSPTPGLEGVRVEAVYLSRGSIIKNAVLRQATLCNPWGHPKAHLLDVQPVFELTLIHAAISFSELNSSL